MNKKEINEFVNKFAEDMEKKGCKFLLRINTPNTETERGQMIAATNMDPASQYLLSALIRVEIEEQLRYETQQPKVDISPRIIPPLPR